MNRPGSTPRRKRPLTVVGLATIAMVMMVSLLSACSNNGRIGYCPAQEAVPDSRYSEINCKNGTSLYCPDDDYVTDPRYDDDECENDGGYREGESSSSGGFFFFGGSGSGSSYRGGGSGSGK